MLRNALILGLLLAAPLSVNPAWAGDDFSLPALGDMPEDEVKLQNHPILGHLADALAEGNKPMGAADLINQAEKLRFDSAPTPIDLLEAQRLNHPPLAANRVEFRLLSYNVGLLSRKKVLGFIGKVEVPEFETRREAMPAALTDGRHDILLLQEVWEDSDAERIGAAAQAANYFSYHGSAEHHREHGLQILIKKGLIADESTVRTGEYQYEAQYGLEYWPGPDIKRGVLWVQFDHVHLGRVTVVDTHQGAFPEFYPLRMQQARELGALIQHIAKDDALVFIGGDMNAGPYYSENTWSLPAGEVSEVWWANAASYPLLLHYTGASDLLAMGGLPQDIDLGQGVENNPQRALELPFGSENWCENTPHNTFTGTDCNSLYFRNYAGTEYPARLDHLLVRDSTGSVHVMDAELEFVEQRDFGAKGQFELSDHYGVSAHVGIYAPNAPAHEFNNGGGKAPAVEEVPAVEAAPTAGEEATPAVEEAPTTDEEAPVGEEVPAAEEGADGEEVPAAEEGAAGEEVPAAEEEGAGGKEAPAEEEEGAGGEEVPAKEEAPAVEEASSGD